MRTKTLLLTAALAVAGASTSMAQSNVYSVNVVGYVNIPLTNGFNMISNPLDKDGTGTNNTITTVFAGGVPDGTTVFKFSGGSYSQSDLYFNGPGWLGGGTITMNPGEGLFVQSTGNATATITGNVLQGNQTNKFAAGFNMIGNKVPISGLFTSQLNYQPTDNDTLFFWDPVSQSYNSSFLYITGPGWLPFEPTINVGQAFFIQAAASNSWTTNFVVQ
jgi:hypothetical protein